MIRGEVHDRPVGERYRQGPQERPLTKDAPSSECKALLLANLDFIERTVSTIARRNALGRSEADDFEGQVKLRMVIDDYAVLRKFQGKSRLTTFLTTVIHNLFRDYRIQQWGKWRSSAAAKRLGDVGVQLESLLYRDHFTFREAAELLRTRFDVALTDMELAEVAAEIRPRTSRRFESDVGLVRLPAPDRGDRRLVDRDHSATQGRVATALANAVSALDREDRLILKLRFEEGLTLRAIAVALDFDQRRIYGRVRRVLRELRGRILAEGIRCEDVLALLDWPACAVEECLSESSSVPSQRTA